MAEAEGVVVVRGGAQGFVQEINAGRHRLTADEPVAAGGTDRGPGPYDLLLAALGSCMSMTIALYARTKQWQLENVVIRLRHSRIYAKDCKDCVVREDTRLDRIEAMQGRVTSNDDDSALLSVIAGLLVGYQLLYRLAAPR